MTRLVVLLLGLSLLAALGCGDSSDPQSAQGEGTSSIASTAPDPTPDPVPADAPTPFTAEEIRAASKVGREWQYRVEDGGTTRWVIMTMTAVDEEGATVRSSTRGGEGVVSGEPVETRSTWEEMRGHAVFPASATTIGEETVETAAGSFDCVRYAVERDGSTATFWFAKSLPGGPVKSTVEKGGAVTSKQMLMKHLPGS